MRFARNSYITWFLKLSFRVAFRKPFRDLPDTFRDAVFLKHVTLLQKKSTNKLVFLKLCVFFIGKVVRVENTASWKVSGRSRKGFWKENRKDFHRVRNTTSRKVSGRSRKGLRKLSRKVLFNFQNFSIVA